MKKIKYASFLFLPFLVMTISSSCASKGTLEDQMQEIYNSAKDSGFKGTFDEWLESLKGDKGEPGKDGYSPKITIGENGNWFIDGKDTGIKATGEDGTPGKDGVSIVSIEFTESIENEDIYTITYSNGTTSTFIVTNGKDGEDGKPGEQGIQGIQGVPGADGHSPVITIGDNGNWFIDGIDTNKKAIGPEGPMGPQGPQGPEGKPGQDGVSIVEIKLTSSSEEADTYTIYYSNGTESTFIINHGKDGQDGETGIQGAPGKDGHTPKITIGLNGNWFIDGVDTNKKAVGPEGPMGPQGPEGPEGKPGQDGVSVVDIKKTSSEDGVDTYTIYYSNGKTSIFTVTNGVDGIQGEQGPEGHTPVIEIGSNGNWYVDGKDTGVSSLPEELDRKKFTVRFHLEGGEIAEGNYFNEEEQVRWGDSLGLISTPKKFGHKFVGWFAGEGVNQKQFTQFDPVFSNLDLYAKYEPGTYSCKLDYGKNFTSEYYEFKFGEKYKLPTNVVTFDKILVEWQLDGQSFPSEGIYNYEDITLNAVYESYTPNTPTSYHINLDYNGVVVENGTKSIELLRGEEYEFPTLGFSKPGYFFAGWYEGNYKRDNKGNFDRNKDVTLKAKWVELKNYNITIDLNGGTTDEELFYNVTNEDLITGVTLPKATKDGYELIGYTYGNYMVTDKPYEISIEKLNAIKESNLTLTARYISKTEETFGDYLYFGSYPQSQVRKHSIISRLDTISEENDKGYIEYKGNQYKKVINGETKYFLVEPILWEVKSDGTLITKDILHVGNYSLTAEERIINESTIYPNNYKYSDARCFLNSYSAEEYGCNNYQKRGFLSTAFTNEERNSIIVSEVDNDVSSTAETENQFICENTADLLYLPSNKEIQNSNLNYINNIDCIKYCSEYAVFNNKTLKANEEEYLFHSYLTRSPDGLDSKSVCTVMSDGSIKTSSVIEFDREQGFVIGLKIR